MVPTLSSYSRCLANFGQQTAHKMVQETQGPSGPVEQLLGAAEDLPQQLELPRVALQAGPGQLPVLGLWADSTTHFMLEETVARGGGGGGLLQISSHTYLIMTLCQIVRACGLSV